MLQFLKHRIRFVFRSILILFGLWFLIFGNYGFVDYIKLNHEAKILKKELIKIEGEKENLAKLVKAISGPEIEIDLLEMQLRKVLAYGRKDEIIFFWK